MTLVPRIELPELVRGHYRNVWCYLRMLGCDPETAEDLTQEVFLAVLRRPFEDRGPRAAGAYLRRVARTQFLRRLRRAERVRVVALADELEDVCDARDGDDAGEGYREALAACLEALTERARSGLDLQLRDGLTRAEIASRLSIGEAGVKKLLQRARAQLRECIDRRLGHA